MFKIVLTLKVFNDWSLMRRNGQVIWSHLPLSVYSVWMWSFLRVYHSYMLKWLNIKILSTAAIEGHPLRQQTAPLWQTLDMANWPALHQTNTLGYILWAQCHSWALIAPSFHIDCIYGLQDHLCPRSGGPYVYPYWKWLKKSVIKSYNKFLCFC